MIGWMKKWFDWDKTLRKQPLEEGVPVGVEPWPVELADAMARGLCADYRLVGSRVTCDPAPTDTDEDVLVLAREEKWEFAEWATTIGFTMGGSDPTEHDPESRDDFLSLRRGDVNLIVVDKEESWRRFLAATHVAKRLNLLEKSDRIALFEAVRYGNQWSEATCTSTPG